MHHGRPVFSYANLLLVSFLSLFIELTMIRWLASEANIFAYLQNILLVTCFLGLGAGSLAARRPWREMDMLGALVVLEAFLCIPLLREGLAWISAFLNIQQGYVTFTSSSSTAGGLEHNILFIAGLMGAAAILAAVVSVFIPLGQAVAGYLADAPKPLRAYSLNIAASLIGTWATVLLAWGSAGPKTWCLVIAVSTAALIIGTGKRITPKSGALLACVVLLPWWPQNDPATIETVWSPYQKLELRKPNPTECWDGPEILVNNTGYQQMLAHSERAQEPRCESFFPLEMRNYSQYDLPFKLHPDAKSVLIIGGGSGNDAAAALRNGAEEIVNVDIDPVIIDMGRRHHPGRPYDSPKVIIETDDARAYLFRTDKKFDLIIFGLLDSHTNGGMANTRLDHFVYTKETIARARALLKPGGMISLSFAAFRDYIADRISRTLQEEFGIPPLTVEMGRTGWGYGAIQFIAGNPSMADEQIGRDPVLAKFVGEWKAAAAKRHLSGQIIPATDDWPYLYLKTPQIPWLFVFFSILLAGLFRVTTQKLADDSSVAAPDGGSVFYFCFGAAFLLLETHNIMRASALLGSTWWVSVVIISAVLIAVLIANVVVERFRTSGAIMFAALLIELLLLRTIDYSVFFQLSLWPRAAAVGLLLCSPIIFSGVLFAMVFAPEAQKEKAIAVNLFGALCGGLLQFASFCFGISALLLIAFGLYFVAYLEWRRRRPARASLREQG